MLAHSIRVERYPRRRSSIGMLHELRRTLVAEERTALPLVVCLLKRPQLHLEVGGQLDDRWLQSFWFDATAHQSAPPIFILLARTPEKSLIVQSRLDEFQSILELELELFDHESGKNHY